MFKKLTGLTAVLVTVLLIFTACEVTVQVTNVDVMGYVYMLEDESIYNTGEGLTSVLVTLTGDGGSYSDYTDSNGLYTLSDVDPGTYTLTAEKSGFVFGEFSVDVESNGQVLAALGGLYGTDDSDIRLLLSWDEDFGDVDSYISTPKGTISNNTTMLYPYDLPGLNNGFHPEEGPEGNREIIGPDQSSSTSSGIDWTENNAEGVEIIHISGFPFINSGTYSTTSGNSATNGLSDDYAPYNWKGVMTYYAISDETSTYMENYTNTDTADAVLYVYFGKDLVGSYELPDYTEIMGASIIQINCLTDTDGDETYQILPNTRVIQTTDDIRSAESGILTIYTSEKEFN